MNVDFLYLHENGVTFGTSEFKMPKMVTTQSLLEFVMNILEDH